MPRHPPAAAIPESVATTDNLPSDNTSRINSSTVFCAPYTTGAIPPMLWDEPEGEQDRRSSGSSAEVAHAVAAAPVGAPAKMRDASTSTTFSLRAITAPALQGERGTEGLYQWQDDDEEGLLGNATSLGDVAEDEVDRSVLTAPALTDISELLRLEEENATKDLHAAWTRVPPSTMGPTMPHMLNPMMNPLMMGFPLLSTGMFIPPMMMPQTTPNTMGLGLMMTPGAGLPNAEPPAPEQKKRRRRRRHRGRGRRGRGKNKAAAAAAEEDGDGDGDPEEAEEQEDSSGDEQ